MLNIVKAKQETFALQQGESALFRYQIVIYDGNKGKADLDALYEQYVK